MLDHLIHSTSKTYWNKKKGIKSIYQVFNNKTQRTTGSPKWNQIFEINIDEQTWKNTYRTCFRTIQDNYLIWLQYRILYRILGTKSYQYKTKIANSPRCTICNNADQTIEHLFTECIPSKQVWLDIKLWIQNKLNITIVLSPIEIILGYQHKNNFQVPLNTIIMVTKSYLFWCSCTDQIDNFQYLQDRIKTVYYEQEAVSKLQNKLEQFEKNWINWKRLLQDIPPNNWSVFTLSFLPLYFFFTKSTPLLFTFFTVLQLSSPSSSHTSLLLLKQNHKTFLHSNTLICVLTTPTSEIPLITTRTHIY